MTRRQWVSSVMALAGVAAIGMGLAWINPGLALVAIGICAIVVAPMIDGGES